MRIAAWSSSVSASRRRARATSRRTPRQAYATRYQLGYTIAADLSGNIFRLYHPPGLPTQIFIGPEGAIHSVVLAPLTEADAVAQIEAILPK